LITTAVESDGNFLKNNGHPSFQNFSTPWVIQVGIVQRGNMILSDLPDRTTFGVFTPGKVFVGV